nr:MAG TPA: minor tail protein [Caudoviricetes sp.]
MSDTVGQIALELGIDSSQIVNQLTGASNKAAKQATSIFSGMGKKIAAGLSIAAFTKFTKDCLEVGSNVTEVQNVVDTAFKDLSGQADQWASNAMTNFGLSELSAKKYMGVFGQMSNAMGITGQAALDMAEDVTGLTGDVASFYNLGTDEAYTKLKSIWTGETETLKDLGVVMTQTNLDQYALNNGFGKTTAKMTEQEKVMLRYQYVTSALSNATGDFVKTQDSWANQTRILSLRFEQLKASLGKGFIALFTPILRGLNTVLAGLQKVADGFATFTQILTGADISSSASSITGLGDIASDTADNVSGIGDAASSTAKQIEKSLAGFDQIEKLSEPTDSSSSSGGGTSSGGLGIDTGVTAETTNVSSAISDMASKVKKALEPLKSISFDNLITSLDNLKESAQPLTEKMFSGLEWAWTNIFVPLATWTIEDALPAFLDVLSAGLDVLNSALDALKPLWDWAWDNFLEPVAEWTGGMIVDILKDLAAALEGISTWISNNQGPFDAIVVTILAFAAACKAVELAEFIMNAGGVVGIINKMKTAIEACTVAKIADKLETVKICALYAKDFVKSIASSITQLGIYYSTWFKVNVLQSDVVKNLKGIVVAIKESTLALKDDIVQWVKNTAEKAKNKAVDIGQSIKNLAIDMAKATKELALQSVEWVKNTAEKVKNKAVDVTTGIKDFVVNMALATKALISQAVQWGISTASKIADTAATAAHTAATWLATAATTAFGVAMSILTSPITLVIAALAALGLGIYELVKHWDTVKEAAGICWDWIVDKWQSAGEWFSGIWESITSAFSKFDDWLQNIFNMDFSKSFGSLGDIMNAYVANVKNIFGDIKNIFGGLIDFITGIFSGDWEKAWNGIIDTFSGIFSLIADVAKAPLNLVIGFINGLITGVQKGINAIVKSVNKLSFKVPKWVPGIGGEDFGFNLQEANFSKIPYLAQGGYVKPNTPQLAMIGDNRHQGEIVAPEDKIYAQAYKAVEAVMSKTNDALESKLDMIIQLLMQILDRTADGDLIMQVGEAELGRIVKRAISNYNRRYNRVTIEE